MGGRRLVCPITDTVDLLMEGWTRRSVDRRNQPASFASYVSLSRNRVQSQSITTWAPVFTGVTEREQG